MNRYDDGDVPCEHIQSLINTLRFEVQVLESNVKNNELELWCVACQVTHSIEFRPRKPRLNVIKGGVS